MGVSVQNVAGRMAAVVLLSLTVSGCGGFSLFGGGAEDGEAESPPPVRQEEERNSILNLFNANDDPNTTLEVNKYLWNASFDVLDFLPIQSADPFTGIIVTGFGTPPGGGTSYRATIFIRDPALEARSLNIALATRSGPVPTETVRAVEDAILTRARQLRLRDLDL